MDERTGDGVSEVEVVELKTSQGFVTDPFKQLSLIHI